LYYSAMSTVSVSLFFIHSHFYFLLFEGYGFTMTANICIYETQDKNFSQYPHKKM
jgi:hypothetical protein